MNQAIDRHYQAPRKDVWTGRIDNQQNERFFQVVHCVDLNSEDLPNDGPGLAIIGFCSDEGVKRNKGRVGAASGPKHIREQLAKLPIHQSLRIVDLGDIVCLDGDLEASQKALGKLIDYCHDQKLKTLVLGGGHEIAFGHYLGLKRHYPSLSIINFDAHFDLREGKPSSGTPFLQIANDKLKLKQPFHYCCIGIQKTANTQTLYHKADELNVTYLHADALIETRIAWQQAILDEFINKQSHVYLSICLDVFAAAIAPGVSAPQALGLTTHQVLPLIRHIMESDKVVSFDIAELSPPLDVNNQTSRLASNIAAELIYADETMTTNNDA